MNSEYPAWHFKRKESEMNGPKVLCVPVFVRAIFFVKTLAKHCNVKNNLCSCWADATLHAEFFVIFPFSPMYVSLYGSTLLDFGNGVHMWCVYVCISRVESNEQTFNLRFVWWCVIENMSFQLGCCLHFALWFLFYTTRRTEQSTPS